MSDAVDLLRIYACLSDRTRLRILHLLTRGPLCVCHVQEVLGEPQVKVSRHLAYLRQHRVVQARRDGHWMIYQLAEAPAPVLQANLDCLERCAETDAGLRRDASRLERLRERLAGEAAPACAAPRRGVARTR